MTLDCELDVSLCFQFKETCAESFVYGLQGPIRYMATFNTQVKVVFMSMLAIHMFVLYTP